MVMNLIESVKPLAKYTSKNTSSVACLYGYYMCKHVHLYPFRYGSWNNYIESTGFTREDQKRLKEVLLVKQTTSD